MKTRFDLVPVTLNRQTEHHCEPIESLILDDSQQFVISFSRERSPVLWSAEYGDQIGIYEGVEDYTCSLVSRHDSPVLYSCSEDKTIKLNHKLSRQLIGEFTGHSDSVLSMTLLGSASLAASIDESGELLIWDLSSREILQRQRVAPRTVHRLTASPDGSMLIGSSHASDLITIWDPRSLQVIRQLSGNGGGTSVILLTTDGTRLICAGRDTAIRVWNLQRGGLHSVLKAHSGVIQQLLVQSNQTTLISSSENEIIVWDSIDHQEGNITWNKRALVGGISITPDDCLLVAANRNGRILVWELATNNVVATYRGEAKHPYCTCISTAIPYRLIVGDELGGLHFFQLQSKVEPLRP